MSAALRMSGPTPARHNLSAAGNVRPLAIDKVAPSSGGNSATSTARGGETDRAFAAIQAAMSPKASPNKLAFSGGATQTSSSDAPADGASTLPAPIPSAITAAVAAAAPPSPSRQASASDSSKMSSPIVTATPHLQASPSGASLRSKPPVPHLREKSTSHESKEPSSPPAPAPAVQRTITKRIEEMFEMQVSIHRKDEYIAGLQRNCETLSALCAKHMQQVTLLKADLDRTTLEKHVLETDGLRAASNEELTQKLLKENNELVKARELLTAKHETLQSKLYSAQHQLSELSDQKEDLTTDLNKERTAAHGLRQELEEMKSILNSDAQSTKNSNNNNNKDGHEFEKKLVLLKKEHESNRLALENLSQAYRTLQQTSTRQGNMLTRLEQEKTVLESDVARWKKQAVQAKRESEADKEIAQAAQEQHQSLVDRQEVLQKENSSLSKRIPDLESSVKTAEKAHGRLKKEYDVLWSTKEDLSLQLNELREELSLARKQVGILHDTSSSAANSARERKDQQAGELILAQEERRTLALQLESLQQRYTSLSGNLRETDSSLEKWKGKYEAAKEEKLGVAREVEEMRRELEQAKADLKSRSTSSDATTENLQQSLLNSAAALRTMEERFDKQSRELTDRKEEVRRGSAELTELREKLALLSSQHASELATLKSHSESYLSYALSAQEKQLAQMQKQLMEEQHRNAELQAVLDAPRMSAAEVARLQKREKELQATVAKLVVSEEATETSFTCFSCVQVFTKPVTCIPCGHSYCLVCIEKSHLCQQCRPPVKVTYYANELLEELSAKYIFRKQALAALKDIMSIAAPK